MSISTITRAGVQPTVRQRGRTWLAALILALALSALPLLDGYLPDSARDFVVPVAQAGCQAGTCG